MTSAQCVCGFVEDEAGDQTIDDHLFEVFDADDDKGTDGLVHMEWQTALTCFCGLAVAATSELDAHLLALFTPGDAIGRDGKKHQLVTGSANSVS